jgi:hypothetical protein
MSDFNELIDQRRLDAAKAAFEALEQAERDATVALEQATADAKSAHDAAQKAADAGANVDKLLGLEEQVEAANRKVSVAQRMAAGARLRRQDGEIKRDAEVRSSHSAALNAAMARFIGIRAEAIAAFEKIKALEVEHIDVCAEFKRIATGSKVGAPTPINTCPQLTNASGQLLMSDSEFANRLDQPHGHEWNVKTGQLRWTE